MWESKADGSFAVSEDSEGEALGRGTQINIYLKVGMVGWWGWGGVHANDGGVRGQFIWHRINIHLELCGMEWAGCTPSIVPGAYSGLPTSMPPPRASPCTALYCRSPARSTCRRTS